MKIDDSQTAYRTFLSWVLPEYFMSTYAKLSFLWFDEIVLETPWKDHVRSTIESKIQKGEISKSVASVMTKQIVTIQKYIPEYDNKTHWDIREPIILGSYFEPILRFAIEEQLDEEYIFKYGKSFLSYEAEDGGTDVRPFLTFNAIRYWKKLNQIKPMNYIPITFEFKVLASMSGERSEHSDFRTFKDVIRVKIPDFSKMSIEKIFELKNNPFFESFRKKISFLSHKIAEDDVKGLKEIIEEVELKDTKELLKIVKPNIKRTIMLSVFANLPIPPVNPLSVAHSLKSIFKKKDIIDKYGWVYFLLDAENYYG